MQFYYEDVQVLRAAEGQIQKSLGRGNSSSLRKKDGGSLTSELETPEAKMLKLEDPKPDTRRDENCQGGQSSTRTKSCVSHLFLVIQKEGLMFRNYQLPRKDDGEGWELQRSFQATVLWLGRPRLWSHPREIGNLPELEESGCDGEEDMTRQEVRQEAALGCGLIRLGAGSSGSPCHKEVPGFSISGKVIFVLSTDACLCRQLPCAIPREFHLFSVFPVNAFPFPYPRWC